MALVPATLQTQLTTVCSSGYTTAASAATAWKNAFSAYMILTVTTSTTVATANSALETSLTTLFSNNTSDRATFLNSFCVNLGVWLASIGTGMAPAYTATPALAAALVAPLTAAFAANDAVIVSNGFISAADAVATVSPVISTWVQTSTATSTTTPFPIVPWS